MPPDVDFPLTSTEDEFQAEEVAAAESEAETDKEKPSIQKETTYESLTEVDESMVDSAVQISLEDSHMED